jgi:hypothetical protein
MRILDTAPPLGGRLRPAVRWPLDCPEPFPFVMVPRETPMAEIEWKPLPTPMWPE